MAKKSTRKTSPPQKKSGGEAAQQHFTDNLVIRGEAVVKKAQVQKLPPGATHWIEGTDEKGKPKLKRARFSLK